MRRLIILSAAVVASLTSLRTSVAQQPAQQDNVIAMQAGVDRLKEDLKWVVNLAPKGAASWKALNDLLDVFVGGIDTTLPMRMDVVLGPNRDYRMWFPIAKGQDKAFRENVQANVGKPARKLSADYWEWKGPGWPGGGGYQRDLKGWSVLASKKENVPAGLPLPPSALAPLVTPGYDMGGMVSNTAAGKDARKKAFQDVRVEAMTAVKRLPDEDQYGFELRKLSHQQQLDEGERFYVDSEKLVLGWTLDTEKKEARLDLTLTALPGTDLEKSIQSLSAEPSAFGGIARTDKTTFLGRINHAIDPMRKAHAKAFLELIKKQALARIPDSSNIKEAHKPGYEKSADQFLDVLLAGLELSVFDGFVHIEKPTEMHTMVGAVRVPDGATLIPVLESLKGAEWEVQLNTETVGDLSLHTLKIPQRQDKDFSSLFGPESLLVVATSKTAIWYAAGDGAAALLKDTVAKSAAAEKVNDGVFIEAWANLGPVMQFLLDRRTRVTVDLTKLSEEDKKARKTKEELLKTAVEAFKPGDGVIHMKIERKDNEVFGRTILQEGLLRFGGIKISDFAEKRLQ